MSDSEKRLGIGLYGTNGHQLEADLTARCPEAQVVAIADGGNASIITGVRSYQTLDDLLADPAVQAVSLENRGLENRGQSINSDCSQKSCAGGRVVG